jgi:hypothetical protein
MKFINLLIPFLISLFLLIFLHGQRLPHQFFELLCLAFLLFSRNDSLLNPTLDDFSLFGLQDLMFGLFKLVDGR